MKKNIGISIIIALLFCFVSCKDSDDDKVVQKPSVNIRTDCITVSISIKEKSSYVNLFRALYDETTKKPAIKTDGSLKEVFNIAEFYNIDSSVSSFSYDDKILVSGVKYTYCIRYYLNGEYVYTGWSTWPTKSDSTEDENAPTTSYSSINSFKFAVPTTSYFEFDKNYSNLTLKNGPIDKIDLFDTYTPCVIISSGEKTRTFKVSSSIAKGSGITDGFIIGLREILTQDFFDKDLTLVGILYEKIEEKPNGEKFNRVMWCLPSPVMIKDSKGTELKTVNIKFNSSTDNNYDYSDFSSSRANNIVQKNTLDYNPF